MNIHHKRKAVFIMLLFFFFGLHCLLPPSTSPAQAATDTAKPAPPKVKKETPTVEKKIGEVDEKGKTDWRKAADAGFAQDVPYYIQGTLPSDYFKYESYFYQFHDTLDPALMLKTDSVVVELYDQDGKLKKDITKDATISYSQQELVVTIVDMRKLTTNRFDKVRVSYLCQLDPIKAKLGVDESNDNYVYLVYSNDPRSDSLGRTVEDKVRLYSWQLKLIKVDKKNEKPLAGAAFTFQDANGQYLAPDGRRTSIAYRHITNQEGILMIRGLDHGTYRAIEVEAPKGYQPDEREIQITITADLSEANAKPTMKGIAAAVNVSKIINDPAQGLLTVTITNTPTDDNIIESFKPPNETSQPPATPTAKLPPLGEAKLVLAALCGILGLVLIGLYLLLKHRDKGV